MSQERLMKILMGPHISEKSAVIADNSRQVVFKVAPDATKPEIAAAVKLLFEVDVKSVRVVNQVGKQKRFGRTMGRRNGFRKAYVTLAEGQDIDFASVS